MKRRRQGTRERLPAGHGYTGASANQIFRTASDNNKAPKGGVQDLFDLIVRQADGLNRLRGKPS